jgi:hypothetical protein
MSISETGHAARSRLTQALVASLFGYFFCWLMWENLLSRYLTIGGKVISISTGGNLWTTLFVAVIILEVTILLSDQMWFLGWLVAGVIGRGVLTLVWQYKGLETGGFFVYIHVEQLIGSAASMADSLTTHLAPCAPVMKAIVMGVIC